jgi:ABC-2 type transport system permease protein
VSGASAVHGIVVRDLVRFMRQKGRLVGGIARSFMWLLLVGAGYNAIARVDGAASYQAFIYPGIVVMAVLFGAMLTAISTVYDREFGMLRLMLASPAGIPSVLAGRTIAATVIGILQGALVLVTLPLFVTVTATQWFVALAAIALGAVASSALGLLVAAPLRSVENFASIVNIVLFPLIFLSGALYPTAHMPSLLRFLAQVNPVSYAVDLTRLALGQGAEFSAIRSVLVLSVTPILAFTLTLLIFDPEQRFARRDRAGTRS